MTPRAMTAEAVHAFYRIADMPPPFTVRVVLHCLGREFLGVRVKGSDGRIGWAEWRGGKAFPVDAVLARALPDIGLWRPQYPDKWVLPLPEPVTPSATGRMASDRLSFAAVEEALGDSADLAREMEADRAHANALHESASRLPSGEPAGTRGKRSLWWLNPAAITYSAPGSISQREAEGRLMRALCPEEFGATAAGQGLGLRLQVLMDDADIRALAEHEAKYPPSLTEPFKPLPADIKDSLLALNWFLDFCAAHCAAPSGSRFVGASGADPHPRRAAGDGATILIHASRDLGLSFAAIGRLWSPKITGQRVGQIYAKAIAEITDIANGKPHPGTAARAQTLAALRDRNRRSHRRERE